MSNEDLEFESQILIQRTKANEEFTKEELESAIISFENIANYANKVINYDALKSLISKEAQYFLDPKNSRKNNKNDLKKSKKTKENSSDIKKKSVRKKS